MLQACYTGAKAADPNCKVMNGGLIRGGERPYAQSMFNAGAKGYFDIFAIHPYTSGGSISLMETSCLRMKSDVLVPQGLGDIPFWVTEFGYQTAGPEGVTQQQQADYLNLFYNFYQKQNKLFDIGFWFTIWDGGAITDSYGLVHLFANNSISQKLSYPVYRDDLPVP